MSNQKNVMIVESFNKTTFKEITAENVPAGMMMVEGIFGVVDVVNRNNRIYSREEYVTHVNDLNKRIQESNGVLGELEHPKSMTIDLHNISHKVMEVKVQENGNVWGKVLLLDTPNGKIAQSVVRSGSPLPISSRAQGQVMENGNVKLSHLATYDLVGTAGFAQAALNEQVMENGQVVMESFILDLNENGSVVEPGTEVNEKAEIDYTIVESMIRRIIAENPVTVAEGAESNENVAEAVDVIMLEKYLPLIEAWVTDEVVPTVGESVQEWVTEEFAPVVEGWVTEEFAPVVENWVTNEFAPVVEGWVTEEFAPVVENWVTNEFAPVVENWVTEEFAPVVENWVTNEAVPSILTESLNNGILQKAKSVNEGADVKEVPANTVDPIVPAFTTTDTEAQIFKSELLGKIDDVIANAENTHDEPAKNTDKPAFVDESAFKHAPVWLRNCPQEYKHIWNQLNESQKDEVYRRSAVRIMETFDDVRSFWNSLNFASIVENKQTPYRRQQPQQVIVESQNVNPRMNIVGFAKNLKK
jgi:hypothetical protein